MSKRGRASSVTGRQDDDGESSDVPLIEPTRKRKKMDPSEICASLYDAIRNHKKEDGTLLCDTFIRVPKRRQDPTYYEVVTNPIDLLKIQQKIKTDDYEDVEDMASDVELMVNNAKSFYKKNTQEYKDAVELWEFFNNTKAKLTESDDRSSVESDKKGKIILKVGKLARKAAAAEARRQDPDDTTSEGSSVMEEEMNQIEELFTAVMQATDPNNRPLNTAFMLLPSRKRYPEYYDVIDNPIDLKSIARKIQGNQYNNINELEKDMLLMTKNAVSFNEPRSQIYKDAKMMKKVIVSRKFDILHGKLKARQGKTKRPRNYQPLSAITAAIKDEDTSENEEDTGGDSDVDLDNPRWQLFEVVRNTTNNGGYVLCEPFLRLPSKRRYPDYYQEIKNPVCLFQIRKKLKDGEYGTVSEVAGDLNIMFENAKKYNRPDSRLYKDAVKLQKLMQHKVKELLDFDQESDTDSDSDNSPILKRDSPIVKKRGRKSAAFIRGKYKDNPPLRKRFLAVCRALTEYSYDDGRQPILMFMEKPSKKLYPEYYKIIAEPIDLLQIQANIKAEKYTTEEQFINDIRLMFNNCRKFNEENSVIYKDANNLEKVLNEKLKELGPIGEMSPKKPSVKTYKPRKKNPVEPKLKALYETIKEFRDGKGRQLSLVFTKLPSRMDYPDYYEVIKKPIDMDKIGSKLKMGQYENLDDLVADLILMLDNACKFNEPDSQIYKDALQLQRVVLQTKLQLREDENLVPDVQAAVQELLTSLFSSVYTHQDEEGRCFSDCMQELPEHDEIDGKKVRGISLDIVKRRLDKGLYKRLDRFQEDLFSCLERARRLSRTDSQVFEDSIELQAFYIRQRDELCRSGDVLSSPALNYNLLHLSAAVEQQKQQKLLKETPNEEEAEARNAEEAATNGAPPATNPAANPTAAGDAMIFNQQQYHVGDFVYIQPRDRNAEPSIIHILRGWTNAEGVQMLYGDCFYRPNETYHVQTRKFLEKEVFKSDQHIAVPLSQVLGRCCVMSVKDYFKFKPEGFDEKDVYVCESRYSSKARMFKKIKAWPFSIDRLTLIPREEPFEPKRIMSVFKDRLEKHITEIAELEEYEKLEEKEKLNIQLMNMPANPDVSAYYQQLNLPWGAIKTGDFVYVETENATRLAAQVDTIWSNKEGECFIKGPWFLRPQEIFYIPGRTFYKQEMFLGCLEDVHPVQNVVGRCCIMEHSDYISCRPTEIDEKDVYICQSVYNEQRRQLSKLVNGLKRYTHSDTVTQDEIYFFRRLINPLKVTSESIALHSLPDTRPVPLQVQNSISGYETPDASLMTPKVEQDMLNLMEDSLDGGPPSVGSGDISAQSPIPNMSTPLTGNKKKNKEKNPTKLVTGYILYSSEIRKGICTSHPEASFGEISRMVGNEWRQLPAEVKQSWEEKAAKMNEEMKEAKALEEAMYPQGHPAPVVPNPPNLPANYTFECLWDNCDYQFDDLNDCLEHAVAESTGHVQTYFASVPPSECEWQCQWKGCNRIKKNCPPFPSLTRLSRHVKEVHVMKSNGRVIPPSERTKNYVPSRRPQTQKPQQIQIPQGQSYNQSLDRNKEKRVQYWSRPKTGTSGQSGPGLVSHHLLTLDSPMPSVNQGAPQVNQKPPEPIFVTVPPRPQRLLHSDAYIKYIEGLTTENRYVSNWDRMLKATQENTPPVDEARLPSHWLANGSGNYGSITNALWALRDFMLRDALNISKDELKKIGGKNWTQMARDRELWRKKKEASLKRLHHVRVVEKAANYDDDDDEL